MNKINIESRPFPLGVKCLLSFIVILSLSWLTHVIYYLNTGEWGFLIAGAILFPIACIHGIIIWFTKFTLFTIVSFLILGIWILINRKKKF